LRGRLRLSAPHLFRGGSMASLDLRLTKSPSKACEEGGFRPVAAGLRRTPAADRAACSAPRTGVRRPLSVPLSARGKKCVGMQNLIEEGEEIYGTLRTWANLLGSEHVAGLLGETLDEGKENRSYVRYRVRPGGDEASSLHRLFVEAPVAKYGPKAQQ